MDQCKKVIYLLEEQCRAAWAQYHIVSCAAHRSHEKIFRWIQVKILMSCSSNPHIIPAYFLNNGQRPAQWGWQEDHKLWMEVLCMETYHQFYLPQWGSMSRPIKTVSNYWLHCNLLKWWICILKFKRHLWNVTDFPK